MPNNTISNSFLRRF